MNAMMSTIIIFIKFNSDANAGGHGMSYALFEAARICRKDTPTLSCTMGSTFRKWYSYDSNDHRASNANHHRN